MQIDEKMQQEGSKNNEKIKKIRVRGRKMKENGDRGVSKMQQNTRLKKWCGA